MLIAFTGAGISKESGIDTFQDRPGIREKLTRSYANRHPNEYKQVMKEFREALIDKEPNDAHKALAEYNVPIITMNVDMLHELAGSKEVIKLHGRIPTEEELAFCDKLYNCPVLYEDPAPMYAEGFDLVDLLSPNDIFLVIGASTYTSVSSHLRQMARLRGAKVIEIQENAGEYVGKFLKLNKDKILSVEDTFLKLKQLREED